jgi:hypothetical protein
MVLHQPQTQIESINVREDTIAKGEAVALRQPLERISVEMVFRSLYHFSRARQLGRASEIVPFLVQNARSFGLIKAQRKRHRHIKSQSLDRRAGRKPPHSCVGSSL